jgi:hypothetical protein
LSHVELEHASCLQTGYKPFVKNKNPIKNLYENIGRVPIHEPILELDDDPKSF